MLHLIRFILFTLFFVLLLLLLQLVGAIALLFVVLFLKKDNFYLPYYLRWFDNYDVYSEGKRDTSVYKSVCLHDGWWARYTWLAWRNPLNFFGYKYTGLTWDGTESYARHNPDEDNIGDTFGAIPGFRHIEVRQHGINYFEYYLIYVYPFNKKVCFRYRLGWKVKDLDNPIGTTSQWVFVISPWKRYDGVQK